MPNGSLIDYARDKFGVEKDGIETVTEFQRIIPPEPTLIEKTKMFFMGVPLASLMFTAHLAEKAGAPFITADEAIKKYYSRPAAAGFTRPIHGQPAIIKFDERKVMAGIGLPTEFFDMGGMQQREWLTKHPEIEKEYFRRAEIAESAASEKAMREYEEWEAPAGAKGAIELAFEMPLYVIAGQTFYGTKIGTAVARGESKAFGWLLRKIGIKKAPLLEVFEKEWEGRIFPRKSKAHMKLFDSWKLANQGKAKAAEKALQFALSQEKDRLMYLEAVAKHGKGALHEANLMLLKLGVQPVKNQGAIRVSLTKLANASTGVVKAQLNANFAKTFKQQEAAERVLPRAIEAMNTRLRETVKLLKQAKVPQTTIDHLKNDVAKITPGRGIPHAKPIPRPEQIGSKRPVTIELEERIQSLVDRLVIQGTLDEETLNHIMEQRGVSTWRYLDDKTFATSTQAKGLVRALLREERIGLARIKAQEEAGLMNPANTQLREAVTDLHKRMAVEEAAFLIENKEIKVNAWKNMDFIFEDLQAKTGKPFYDLWWMSNRIHLENKVFQAQTLRRIVTSVPGYGKIIRSKKALDRIRIFVAGKNKYGDVKPGEYKKVLKEITDDEKAVAHVLEDILNEWQEGYRFQRFIHWYNEGGGTVKGIKEFIKDAPVKDIKKAITEYEIGGARALRKYLVNKKWGIIGEGYEPHVIFDISKQPIRRGAPIFATGKFKPRSGIHFLDSEKSIVDRVIAYDRQMHNYRLKDYLTEIRRNLHRVQSQFKNPRKVSDIMGLWEGEMLGYIEGSGHPMYRLFSKFAAQAYTTIFTTYPVLPFRNLFQNLAWHPDRTEVARWLASGAKFNKQEWLYYHTYISQMEMIPKGLFLAEAQGLPGFGRINMFMRKLNVYGASDSKINRVLSFGGSLTKARRALSQYHKDKDIQKFMKTSGIYELTRVQQEHILRTMARKQVNYAGIGLKPIKGEEAAIREIALEITNNVHFLYDRAQRAPVEMGAIGRLFGSLMVFPRSMVQRMYNLWMTLHPNSYATSAQKKRALESLVSMSVGGMLAGELFKRVTNRVHNPYNPLEVISWEPGGLVIGSVQGLAALLFDITRAVSGDEAAFDRIPTDLSQAGDMFIPWYKTTLNALEAFKDAKYLDRKMMRRVIELLDAHYEINEAFYEKERIVQDAIKHGIFGTEKEEKPKDKALRLWNEAELKLGEFIEDDEGGIGYLYQMPDLRGEYRRVTRDISPQTITEKNGYSNMAVLIKDADSMIRTYYDPLSADKRIEFRESNTNVAAWVEAYLFLFGKVSTLRNPRSLAALQAIISIYGIPEEAVPNYYKLKEEQETEYKQSLPLTDYARQAFGVR